jgi:precorrin-3B C17-methyltransferase
VVCVVSGGDPGVFAMAAAVCEAIDNGPDEWRAVDLVILPGITAMLAVAARVGAPLGHDFCAISLSDNLKPWATIETPAEGAAEGGFVIALYNPISKARPWQLGKAFELLREHLPDAHAGDLRARRRAPGRTHYVQPLSAQADAATADMATCVIIGSAETRVIARDGKRYRLHAAVQRGENR